MKAGMFPLHVWLPDAHPVALDIEKIGGLAGKLPLVAASFLIAFAGIGGIPGFNGYVSKTILHHAIVETAEHSRLPSFVLAEKIFVLTGALTLCYFAKLFSGLFLGELPRPLAAKNYRLPKRVYAVLFVSAAAILAIGLFPSLLLEKAVIPGLAGLSLDAGHLHGLNVWNFGDLRESLIILSLAAVIYPVLLRLRFFALQAAVPVEFGIPALPPGNDAFKCLFPVLHTAGWIVKPPLPAVRQAFNSATWPPCLMLLSTRPMKERERPEN
jgi:formate hydrogenlyase subunit 3/multisubunit Na+/H+ antiporter MnhD subunit